MPNCGWTELIPDCLEHQNGKWKITYNVPIAGYVRYKYPSGDWVNVIGGVRYTTEISNPANFSGGQCQNVLYNIYIDVPTYRVDGSYVGRIIRNLQLRGKISTVGFFHDGFYTIVGAKNTLGESVSGWATTAGLCPTDCGPSSIDARISPVTSRITRADGQSDNCGDPPGGGCIFKVFNVNNQVIYQETRSVCPTAEIVPCHYLPENEKNLEFSPYDLRFNRLQKGLIVNPTFTLEGQKGAKAEICDYPFQNLPGNRSTILDLYSPKGCSLHPKICWECDGCIGKKCPEGTCLKCCDGDRICCYGSDGQVLAYADKDCEECDC